jgi:hypothetical protein
MYFNGAVSVFRNSIRAIIISLEKKTVSSCNQATITYINNITIYEKCIKGYK